MLCGRAPFVADGEAATALARLQRDPLRPRQVRPGVPKALEEIVCRAMAREPQDRYDTAADLRAALLSAGATPSPEPDLTATNLAPAPHLRPVPAGGRPAPPLPAPAAAPSFRQTERSWLVPTVVLVVVALALGIAGLLLGRSGAGDLFGGVGDAIGGTPDAGALALSRAAAFDPFGDDQEENDDRAENVRDDDPDTAWTTERYNNRDITVLKPGVGLVLTAERRGKLAELGSTSPTNDWTATFYVADRDPGPSTRWGEPVTTARASTRAPPRSTSRDATGQAVLVWITDRGDGTPDASVEIGDAALRGVPE